jgi:aspartate aminotransferase-like enzyme
VHEEVLQAYSCDYGSADLEDEFFQLYASLEGLLQAIMGTSNRVAIMAGEGMLALWGALKSVLEPGDRVVAVSTGPFGRGIGEMAAGQGADVRLVEFEYDQVCDGGRVEQAIGEFDPKMVTMVHCETPAGTLNPVADVGEAVRAHRVPLFYVDAVASAGGATLATDEWNIDLCLVGSQKCLSAPPELAMVSVSERAWEVVERVGYRGYDALAPWKEALDRRYFPYTMCWQSIAALDVACRRILEEGVDEVVARHEDVGAYCRRRAGDMGLRLYPKEESSSSPTVTALRVPDAISWPELDDGLRRRGMVVGGSWEKLAGKVFRIGHMGSQADMELVRMGMDVLEETLAERRGSGDETVGPALDQ